MSKEHLEFRLRQYPDTLKSFDVAAILNVTERHVKNLIDAGSLKGFPANDSDQRVHWRVFKEDLIEFMLRKEG